MRTIRLMHGSTFAGRYRVERTIGHGAMGLVYEVEDTTTGERLALKTMSAELATDPRFCERFVQEAAIGAVIESEHVVDVRASGVDESTGLPWMAMELLVGVDLAAWRAGSPGPAAIRRLLAQLFEALSAAHRRGIVHRDLKPENLYVVAGPDGGPHLEVLDFGVAKIVKDMTLGGTAPGLGTPLWAAPEQAKAGQKILPRADVWALGLLTFYLLTGKQFWRGLQESGTSSYDLALEIVRSPIPLASARAVELGVSPPLEDEDGFDEWFARCVNRDPAARFEDAAEAWAALAPRLAPQPEPARGPGEPLDRRRAVLLLGALVVVIAALGLVFAIR